MAKLFGSITEYYQELPLLCTPNFPQYPQSRSLLDFSVLFHQYFALFRLLFYVEVIGCFRVACALFSCFVPGPFHWGAEGWKRMVPTRVIFEILIVLVYVVVFTYLLVYAIY